MTINPIHMKQFLLLSFLLISFNIYSQDVLMQNGTVSTCSGLFFDSGGEFGDYSNSEDLTFTICPDEVGGRMRIEFYDFITQINLDILTIYDGDSTSAPEIGSYSGGALPGLVFASFDNPTGCLTFNFVSNNSGNSLGWKANITCATPCQDITAQLDSTSPAQNMDGIIEVCTGDLINLQGSGIFSESGTGATYTWDLGNGEEAIGQNVDVIYDEPGVYLVNLDIRDTNMDNYMDGCPNSNSINLVIRVSGSPDFSGTQALDNTLCFGETTTIEGVANPRTLIYNCPPPESEETFLPDGSGVAYLTCINVTCFEPGTVLTDISQIFDICMNIEHSYSGDLDIKLISPNGQETLLFDQGGGGTSLGGANDDSSDDPGIGADYCFSMSATVLLEDANTIEAGTNPPKPSFEPGTYLPVGSFDSLLGSPLNGEWCLEIVDNLAIDNGYIFSWELNFDESVPQEDFEYVVPIVSQSWDSDTTIIETNGNTITVAPDASGEFCYVYRVTDAFGCEYSEEVCVNVSAPGAPPTTFYADTDGDGYGDPNNTIEDCSAIPPFGFVLNSLDCNDINGSVNPDASDSFGNGIDENCDGVDGNLLSIDDFEINNIKVLSNPFNSILTIEVPSSLVGKDLKFVIYDLNGRTVFEDPIKRIEDELISYELNSLNSSYYFLEIVNLENGQKQINKLLKN